MNNNELNHLVARTLRFETRITEHGAYEIKPDAVTGDDDWTDEIPNWAGDLNYAYALLKTAHVDFSIDHYNNNGSSHVIISIGTVHCQNIKSTSRAMVAAWLMYKGVDNSELLGLWKTDNE